MEESCFQRTYHQEEDNRFMRDNQEYQREKEALRAPPIRHNAGRFECLRDDNYVRYPHEREFNRFSDNSKPTNDVIYLSKETFGRQPVKIVEPVKPVEPVKTPPHVVYLPRPTPKVETQVTPSAELWKPRTSVIPQKPVSPAVTFDSNYHFPKLLHLFSFKTPI